MSSVEVPFVLSVLHSHVQTIGSAPYLYASSPTDNQLKLSFNDLNELSLGLSAKLSSDAGVRCNDAVLVVYNNPSELVVGSVACFQAGAIAGKSGF